MVRPRQVSDEQIVAAMRANVLDRGSRVSLETVAMSVGVTAPALLKRFGSRQALMLAALQPCANPAWIEQVKKGPTQDDLQAQLVDMFIHISTFMYETVPAVIALRESGLPHEEIFPDREVPERGRKAVRRWLEAAHDRGLVTARELDTAAYAIIGALQTKAFISHLMQRKVSKREQRAYAQELACLFARSLTSIPSQETPASPRKTARIL